MPNRKLCYNISNPYLQSKTKGSIGPWGYHRDQISEKCPRFNPNTLLAFLLTKYTNSKLANIVLHDLVKLPFYAVPLGILLIHIL